MTPYEELLRDENAILRKRIAFLEEENNRLCACCTSSSNNTHEKENPSSIKEQTPQNVTNKSKKQNHPKFKENRAIYNAYNNIDAVNKNFEKETLNLLDDFFNTDMTQDEIVNKYHYSPTTITMKLFIYMNNLKAYLNDPENFKYDCRCIPVKLNDDIVIPTMDDTIE